MAGTGGRLIEGIKVEEEVANKRRWRRSRERWEQNTLTQGKQMLSATLSNESCYHPIFISWPLQSLQCSHTSYGPPTASIHGQREGG